MEGSDALDARGLAIGGSGFESGNWGPRSGAGGLQSSTT